MADELLQTTQTHTALTMYDLLSAVKAAIRGAHHLGNDKLLAHYLADKVAATYRGMMTALPQASPRTEEAVAGWIFKTGTPGRGSNLGPRNRCFLG
jgi:hypothetical protein